MSDALTLDTPTFGVEHSASSQDGLNKHAHPSSHALAGGAPRAEVPIASGHGHEVASQSSAREFDLEGVSKVLHQPGMPPELGSNAAILAIPTRPRGDSTSSTASSTSRRRQLLSQVAFFASLFVFYIGSKGCSQLFASYLATNEHLEAPIYLTACEYAMWILLGSIYEFTKDSPDELDRLPEDDLDQATGDRHLPNSLYPSPAQTPELEHVVVDTSATVGSSNTRSLESPLIDAASRHELISPAVEMQAISIEAGNEYHQLPSSSLQAVSPTLRAVAAAEPTDSSTGLTRRGDTVDLTHATKPRPGHCQCRCRKCRGQPTVYPGWKVTLAYLGGELTKTILEVITVTHVELSLALVLLATAPLFSILFRYIFERRKPKAQEWLIVTLVTIGLLMRIPEIADASVLAVIGGLVSAASAAWISSFKSLIFDPVDAPHVLAYMCRFGPPLCLAAVLLSLSSEMSALKLSFRNADESFESISFGLLFALMAAPSSVVSKRLQRVLGSFQRTLLGVFNNVFVALVSALAINTGAVRPAAVVGSMLVFASPCVNFLKLDRERIAQCELGHRLLALFRRTGTSRRRQRTQTRA